MFQSEAASASAIEVGSTHLIGWLAFTFLAISCGALAFGKVHYDAGLIAMIVIFGPVAVIILLLDLRKYRRTGGVDLRIDDRGIRQHGWLSTTAIAWPDLMAIECYICGNATVTVTGRDADGDETTITVAPDLNAIGTDDLIAILRKHRPDLKVHYTGLFYGSVAEPS